MEVVSRTEGAKRMPDVKQVADGAKTIACEGDTKAEIVFPIVDPSGQMLWCFERIRLTGTTRLLYCLPFRRLCRLLAKRYQGMLSIKKLRPPLKIREINDVSSDSTSRTPQFQRRIIRC
jgi:hypothetical protein